MYNYYQAQAAGLKGRPVSSIEEAKVSPIDFDGSIFFFPDISNGKIYTKQINKDGTCSMYMYTLTEMPQEKPVEYVTREELAKALAALKNSKGGEKFEF